MVDPLRFFEITMTDGSLIFGRKKTKSQDLGL
jgi:hypothetical protein